MKRQLLCLVGICGLVWSEPCEMKKTCRECILNPIGCAWCSSEKLVLDNRCRPLSMSSIADESWCPNNDIQNPLSNITIADSQEFSHIIQLKPQKYHLDVRVGNPVAFSFTYKAAENFPVDVYFLLDVSKSMEIVKEGLLRQSTNIFNTLTNLTKDVYMGLGTFIDKNMLPFHFNINAKETYSFKHQLSLTDNMTAFHSMLNSTTFGTNYDEPESGLDGIAQVIACKKRINWREQSHKFLIHITDASFHSAGDGLNAGLTKPYDGECYLDDEGFYTMEKEMDYPSVGHINKLAADEQLTILFISRSKDDAPYFNLMNAVYGSYFANYDDEYAITSRLTEIYESITQKIVLRVNLTSQTEKHINVNFEPNCGETSPNTTACSIQKGEEKYFYGSITVSEYFGVDQLYLGINPKGLKEDVSLNVNVITGCRCDSEMERNSSTCSYSGDRNCGVCECYEDKFGPICGCLDSHSDCKPNGTDIDCSGHGSCICGTCEGNCRNGFSGKYCEYSTSNCPKDKLGVQCSNNGDCIDGVCACAPGWTGEACDCTSSKADCIDNGVECNNRGQCRCGSCACYDLSKWDVRSYRDDVCGQTPCFDCHQRQCRKLIDCVKCYHESLQCEDICGGNMTVVKGEVPEELRSEWNACLNIRMDFGCYANFSYIYNESQHDMRIVLFVLDEKNCQENQIIIGVISAVVLILIGLLTLIAWKVLTTIRDRREYQQFLKKAQEMESEEMNEIYKAPCTTYLNPAFQVSPDEKDDDK